MKREQLKQEIDKNQILELFVCEYSAEEIAKKLECTSGYVEKVLADSMAAFYRKNTEYAERAALLHLAKTRALSKKWMPIALDGSLSAAQFMLKVIETERKIIGEDVKAKDVNSTAEDVQHFEQTLTSTDPRYAIALENLTEEWMDARHAHYDKFELNIPIIQDDATTALAALHATHHNLEEEAEVKDEM